MLPATWHKWTHPALTPATQIYLPQKDGKLSRPRWLVAYQDTNVCVICTEVWMSSKWQIMLILCTLLISLIMCTSSVSTTRHWLVEQQTTVTLLTSIPVPWIRLVFMRWSSCHHQLGELCIPTMLRRAKVHINPPKSARKHFSVFSGSFRSRVQHMKSCQTLHHNTRCNRCNYYQGWKPAVNWIGYVFTLESALS